MYVGKPVLRGEDNRFLTGDGQYIADISVGNSLWAAFVRSPYANANIRSIDTATAARSHGVVKVLTADDWHAAGLGSPACQFPIPSTDGTPMNEMSRPVLACRSVRHVGDTVAAVIAERKEQAIEAAELISVDYEELPAVTHPQTALSSEAVVIHPELGTNLVQRVEHGDAKTTNEAFSKAAHIEQLTLRNMRVAGLPMEPRGAVGYFDRLTGRYTIWVSVQNPHMLQRWLAEAVLKVAINKVRVISPDVGGGFGVKAYFYPEPAIVLWASKLLRQPVRWNASRGEAFMVDTHARDLVTHAEMAFDERGQILGIRGEAFTTYGAYMSNMAPAILTAFPGMLTGLYKTATANMVVNGVYTNTVPIDAYRGGTQAPTHINERLVENGARSLGLDPMIVRRNNYLSSSDYPYTNPLAATYDSGHPLAQHERLLELADYTSLRAEQAAHQEQAIRMGLGFAGFVETTGMGPSRSLAGFGVGGWESAVVRVHPDSKVTLFAGTHSHGQSHEITFRQVAADALQLPISDIEFTQGDTDLGPGNFGTAAARAISIVGAAIEKAAARILRKATQLAAHHLECSSSDIEYAQGTFAISGTDRSISFQEVAKLAYTGEDYPEENFELGLEETVFEDPTHCSNPIGMHLAVVLIDIETGAVNLRDYYTVDDCGRIINPMVVEGQVHGGLAQGIGHACLEGIIYEPDSGQLLTGSFMDYALPRADDLPNFKGAFMESFNTNNSLGVKGGSESGVCGPSAAIGNAIVDALWDFGVKHIDTPYTSERIWRAIQPQ